MNITNKIIATNHHTQHQAGDLFLTHLRNILYSITALTPIVSITNWISCLSSYVSIDSVLFSICNFLWVKWWRFHFASRPVFKIQQYHRLHSISLLFICFQLGSNAHCWVNFTVLLSLGFLRGKSSWTLWARMGVMGLQEEYWLRCFYSCCSLHLFSKGLLLGLPRADPSTIWAQTTWVWLFLLFVSHDFPCSELFFLKSLSTSWFGWCHLVSWLRLSQTDTPLISF